LESVNLKEGSLHLVSVLLAARDVCCTLCARGVCGVGMFALVLLVVARDVCCALYASGVCGVGVVWTLPW